MVLLLGQCHVLPVMVKEESGFNHTFFPLWVTMLQIKQMCSALHDTGHCSFGAILDQRVLIGTVQVCSEVTYKHFELCFLKHLGSFLVSGEELRDFFDHL